MRHIISVCSFFIGAVFSLQAQSTKTISGLITRQEDGSPVEGATVWVKGTDKYSGTQADGMYYINTAPTDSIIVFSFSEYAKQERRLDGSNEYNIALSKTAVQPAKKTQLFNPIGNWRGEFSLANDVKVPFQFSIEKTNSTNKVFFKNAEEKFDGGTSIWTNDSLFILLDQFDSKLSFAIRENRLEGVFQKQDGSGSKIPVNATQGEAARFTIKDQSVSQDISGTYDISLGEEKAVGLLTQNGTHLRGTLLRITGDSRFLEGVVEGNEFYLSSFIGSGPVYYRGKINDDKTLSGEILTARGSQAFSGSLNDNAELPDPYQLTLLKDGYEKIDFQFPDVNGKQVSLKDDQFKNKVVIVTITGTWCPNCVDETAFIAPWYKKNKKRGVEVIALHYERNTDSAFTRKVLTRLQQKFDVQYTQLVAGVADKQSVAASLPALNSFLSFPTTIFIDKNGKVAKIHTGYSGPATAKYYDQFVKEFNAEVDQLLK